MSMVVFRGNFAENLRFGHVLEICGKAKEEAQSFSISLKSSTDVSADDLNVGLQILVNFNKNVIVLRKHLNGEWCDEESKAYETSALMKEFKIYIAMADEKFHISVNKAHLDFYKYRLRLSLLTVLEIDGDLDCVRQVDHRKYFPYSWPPIQVVEERLQFSGDVPMPFKSGHIMVITCKLQGNENGRFVTQLRNITDMERQEFHMSVRFDTKTLVRTSKTIAVEEHYKFGDEEKGGNFPFEDFLKPFRLAFAFTDKQLILAKDGQILFGFKWRSPHILPLIGGLKLFGVNGVQMVVSQLDHIQMEDDMCHGFESYSILDCLENEY
ncbi:32 kDa beta-galactoside-binding lectin [Stomoxys calcitrans]|uniref:Galectin n=1 Tax=Stomoxys calcitrans TaxID=35570 RepID=A0A1I8Q2Z5_STOCA|nr:32 kDa beta-galactoside-binding lectin [Stomoxys calcitrans]